MRVCSFLSLHDLCTHEGGVARCTNTPPQALSPTQRAQHSPPCHPCLGAPCVLAFSSLLESFLFALLLAARASCPNMGMSGTPPCCKPSLAFHCSLDKNQQGVAVSVYNDTGHLMKGGDRPRPRVLALYSPSQMENPAVTTAVPTEGTSLPGLRVPTGAPHLG